METTKFHELCGAYDAAQENFNTYEKDCHIFSMEFVREIKAYYQIPESQFSLFKTNKEGGFELVPSALIHALSLDEDHHWNFGFGLTVCRALETLPEELILVHIMFRKNGNDEFFIKYAFGGEEYKIEKGNSESYIPFFDFLFSTIIGTYQGQMQQFIGVKTTRKLGYIQ